MRTRYKLYEYYRPDVDFYTTYYSPTYKQTYTDGYGYDFYYGGYSFYEYSKLPIKPILAVEEANISLFITVASIDSLFVLFTFSCAYSTNGCKTE